MTYTDTQDYINKLKKIFAELDAVETEIYADPDVPSEVSKVACDALRAINDLSDALRLAQRQSRAINLLKHSDQLDPTIYPDTWTHTD